MSPLSTTLVEMEKNRGSNAGPPSVALCQGPLLVMGMGGALPLAAVAMAVVVVVAQR